MPNSIKVYQDSERFATLTHKSSNIKTGNMEQLTILPWISPEQAVKLGLDSAVCGDCAFSGKANGGTGLCYVNTGQAPRAVWSVTKDAEVEAIPASYKPIRLGAYGDPAFLPLALLKTLTNGRKHTGYTHQWETCDKGYSSVLMASIDDQTAGRKGLTAAQLRQQAKAKGYRTFRAIRDAAEMLPGEIMCPNTTKGIQCADCGLCNGASGAKDIVIQIHGPSKGLY